MDIYEIAVRQVGTGYMYLEAKTPEEAIENAGRLVEAGTAQTIISYDGWDSEEVVSATHHTSLEKEEQDNLRDNAERLDELGEVTG